VLHAHGNRLEALPAALTGAPPRGWGVS